MATKPVVVGADGSEESLRAVEWGALEAERRRSPLWIVSAPAMPPRMRAHQASPETVTTALRGISARALGVAITRAEEIAPGLLIDTDLLCGPPAVAVADSGSGASMLVVGARGAGGFAAMLLGSVSRYAATHARCPVVVVREETTAVHREIAVGVRDPQDGTEALAFGFEEAALRGAELVVVHSWYGFPATLLASAGAKGAEQHSADPQQVTAEAAGSLAETVTGWRDKYPTVRVRQDVVHGHPARVLASYAARADLVVLGRHGGPGTSPGIGSIQHAVLNHAGGPVAVVPSGY
ncbi:MAG: universal stress protein [Streptosporangiaceae bacterium]|nr:universal stress protein [Streptosporangiaceae bacterium]MBV9856507.1 universal stress protein [Streptosporangiaceae bacterium]